MWDTWIVGAPIAGQNVDTTLTVAEVADLNHDGIYNDAPNVVPDLNHDGRVDAKDLGSGGRVQHRHRAVPHQRRPAPNLRQGAPPRCGRVLVSFLSRRERRPDLHCSIRLRAVLSPEDWGPGRRVGNRPSPAPCAASESLLIRFGEDEGTGRRKAPRRPPASPPWHTGQSVHERTGQPGGKRSAGRLSHTGAWAHASSGYDGQRRTATCMSRPTRPGGQS